MTKSALVIRNVSQLSVDEIDFVMQLAGLNKAMAPMRGEYGFIAQFKQAISEEDTSAIRQLLESSSVRDYLYNQINAKTGHYLILHLDETSEDRNEINYILNKLAELEDNMQVDLLYMGGGHGGYVGLSAVKLLSGLKMEYIDELTTTLRHKSITFNAVILHSCSSALFVRLFRPCLTEKGVLLSYSAEIGSSSNWEMTAQWMLDKNKPDFFSSDALAKPWESGDLGTTTSIISTKKTNLLMNLDENNADLPDYVDASEDSTFQRALVLEQVLEEEGIKTDIITDVREFNDVVAMEQFNNLFNLAIIEQREMLTEESRSVFRLK